MNKSKYCPRCNGTGEEPGPQPGTVPTDKPGDDWLVATCTLCAGRGCIEEEARPC